MSIYRPITVYDENVYSFILMRNRTEVLAEIPVEYVESISFNMGKFINEPAQLNIRIPSVMERSGKMVEQPLYHLVKAKMQIHMTINGKHYMLDIRDVQEKETKNYTVKTITAYERHKRWEELDCVISIGSIATRQLYRTPEERVEMADGMLNIFENQCTGWSVEGTTQLARQEYIYCSSKETLYLNPINIEKVRDVIFDQDLSATGHTIDIGEKPLNMTLNIFNEVYDADGNLYIDSTSSFKIESLPYPIRKIAGKVLRSNKHFYGIEITITHTNGYTTVKEFDYVNCKGLHLKADINIEYELGDLIPQWTTKYRTFENGGSTWSTMLENIAQSFDCIFIVDSYNQSIRACHNTEFGEDTGITLMYDNAIKEITRSRGLNDLVTRMWVESSNTQIASVNVLGTDYIECYDYFRNEGIMSYELSDALDTYDLLLAKKDVEFNNLILDKYEADQKVNLLTSQITALEERLEGARAILTAYIKQVSEDGTSEEKSMWKQRQANQQAVVDGINNELTTAKNGLAVAQQTATNYQNQIIQIGIDIKKENATYNNKKIFNEVLLLELSDYLIEKSIEDDTHLTAHSLYNYANNQVKKYQKQIIDFTISTSMEFLKRAGRQVTDVMFLGAKVAIEDRANALDSEDGIVIVYSLTIDPKTDAISNFKFTNSAEAPDTALKSISRTAQTAKVTKTLSDFYKATWVDIKDKTLDIEKILKQGLDLATQKVRSRTEENIIDITEAGIFCIDAKNNNEQLALMNDLITMTTDNWRTAKVAISPEGVMADTIIGRLLMGSELYISNADTSFHIDDVGLKVKDRNGTQKLFMGLYNQQPWFLIGDTNNNYLQWWDNKLEIKATSIKIGASNVATNDDVNSIKNSITSSFEIEYNKIRMYVDDTSQQLQSLIQVTNGQIQMYIDDTSQQLRSLIQVENGKIVASVNDKVNNLQAQINVNSNGISTKVSKGDIVSSINQSAENVKIKASKIDLNGTVTVTGNNRHIKIEDANYGVFDGNIRKAYLGFRGVSGTDYVVPKFVLSATNTEGANECFVVTPYKGNKENPQSTDYGYVDISYHTYHYSASTGGDWSNVKLYANGDMRVSPIRKLEVTTNFNKGEYGGGYERLIAEFRSDNHTWYNGNISVGAIVNRTNGNGLILIDQHDSRGWQAGVRIQCNDDGGHSFRPLTNGECYNGTSNYRWKRVYAISSTISTSDERHKVIFDNMNTFDCYEMVKNIPLYNYYMLGENKEHLTDDEIKSKMIDDNKQMGLMAQDLLEYECGQYIIDYADDIYGINDNQLIQATIGALQEEIKLRDKQIDQLTNDLEELKQCVKLLMGGE